jgi:hypothetical protein
LADGVASSQTVAVRVSLLPEADDARDSADNEQHLAQPHRTIWR